MGKFELQTFIYKNGLTFSEFEDKNDLIDNFGENEFANILGYFDKCKNLRLDECLEDTGYLICYISSESGSHNGEHIIVKANNRFELVVEYNKLIDNEQDECYINIFKLDDLIYV